MFPEQFKKFKDSNQRLDHTNQLYQNLIERVTDYLDRAKELINNV